jgi:MFS family permease
MKRAFHNSTRSPSLWRHRDLRLVVPARTLSFVGDELAMIALTLRVHDQGGSALGIALLMAAFALPTVLMMGVAGSVADRVDSRRVLLVSTVVQVAACAGLALVSGSWATYLLVVVLQCGQAVANPTWGALVPRIAGDQDVGRVLALQQSLLAVTAIAGAALAGLVVGTHGSAAALWLDAATFGGLLLAAALVRTRRGGARAEGKVPVARTRTLDGLRVLRRDRLLWLVFAWTVPFVIVLEGVNVVEVFLVRDDLGASATTYGLLQAFFGAGAVVGSYLAGRCGTDAGRVRVLLAGLAGTAGAIVLAGISPAVAFLAGSLVLLGGCNGAVNATLGPLYLLRTPEAERGRVLAAVGGVSRTGSVIALGLGGVTGGLLGPRGTFVLGGGLALLVVTALCWSLRGVDRQGPRLASVVAADVLDGVNGLVRHGVDAAAVAQVLHQCRDERHGDDGQHRQLQLVLQHREGLPQEVPEQGDPGRPQHRSDQAPGEEPAAVHPADAGDDGDERAHDRHEPTDDQGLVAVMVEEGVGLVEVALLEEPAVPLVERCPHGAPDLVADDVAQERRRRQDDARHGDGDVHLAAGDEQADREQQRVAGQDREQQPALDEDDQGAEPEELRPEARQQVLGVHPLGTERVHHGVEAT